MNKTPTPALPTPMNVVEQYLYQMLLRLDELIVIQKGGEKINEPKPVSVKSKK